MFEVCQTREIEPFWEQTPEMSLMMTNPQVLAQAGAQGPKALRLAALAVGWALSHCRHMEDTTPTKKMGMADTSPGTVANAAQAAGINPGTVSPMGSTGTEKFGDYLSESGDEAEGGLSNDKAVVGVAPKTPAKTVLPDDYDASSGNTPAGFEGTWREVNARVNTTRDLVPGHTSSPRVPPGPFYVDTPPSAK